jgi:hypothetical protein
MKVINRYLAATLAFASCFIPAQLTRADDSEAVTPADPAAAVFEGATLDLARSWGNADACIEIDGAVECYRTERELDAAHPEFSARQSSSFVALASCSSSLRLYRSNSYTGGTLVLTTRGVVINLSTYGFDNDTSSYRVGACSSTFLAGSSGSGSVYPGNTSAWASAASMLAAWNNFISSVYIS